MIIQVDNPKTFLLAGGGGEQRKGAGVQGKKRGGWGIQSNNSHK